VVEKNWNNFEKKWKTGRSRIKNKNSSDLDHVEIKLGKRGTLYR